MSSQVEPSETVSIKVVSIDLLTDEPIGEYLISRSWLREQVVQETVLETRYNPTDGTILFENRAVEPERARKIIERCDFNGQLARSY